MDKILIILIIVCLVLSAFFSGAEMAYAKVNKVRLERENEKKVKGIKSAHFFVTHYDETISTILIGNNLVNIAASSMATILFINAYGPQHGELYSTIFMTLLVLVFGEIIPKTICASYSYTISKLFSYPMRIFYIILYPFTAFVRWLLNGFNKRLKKHEDKQAVTDDELQLMVDNMEEEGMIDEDAQELINNAIDFIDVDAVEVMVHRTDFFAYDIDDDINELINNPELLNYSRIPVYQESIDNILGILNTKELIKKHLNKDEIDIKEMLIEPLYVFPTQAVSDVLKQLREKHLHMAIIKDEYGGTLGLLTIEDIVEELVGEIYDEKDKEELEEYHKVSPNRFTVDGDMNLYDFFDLVGYDYEKDEFESIYTTIGGWITGELEKFPEEDDSFDFNGHRITVIRASKFTVERISVYKYPDETEQQ